MKSLSAPHRHGGNPGLDFKRFHLPEKQVLDFSVNINPLGMPELIRQNWPGFLEGLESYPNLEGAGMARYFKETFNLAEENVLSGNGSTELIYLIPRALGLKQVLVLSPSYNDYGRACLLAGAKVKALALDAGDHFRAPELQEIRKAARSCDAVWFGNPHNPSATLFEREWILELAGDFADKWIIVDEAFMLFLDDRKERSLLYFALRPNILILYSLTKFYALAGIRLGALVGQAEAVARLREAKEPWTVNKVADRMALLLPECIEYAVRSRELVQRESRRMLQALESMPAIIPCGAAANFILCRWQGTPDLDDLQRRLLSQGLYVRDCRNFSGLENNFFRLAVRLPHENDLLLAALSAFEKVE